jgi:hypothetical protein
MTDPLAARSFLLSEIESLEPFGFVAAVPSGRPFSIVKVARGEAGDLEVEVPGRSRPVPPLESRVQDLLLQRGFASEDAADPSLPWARSVADAESAVEVLQSVLVEVFGEKADANLDVGHGSHEAEVEARKRLAIARARIETIVTDVLGRRPEQDSDLDFVLPIGDVHVTVAVRATPDGQIVIRIFAITNVGVTVSNDLGLFLARLNFGLMFGRFALDAAHQAIWFDESLLGEEFREEELRFAIRVVASTSDEWDDRLKQMFGGATYQEFLTGQTPGSPPPTKPGEGVGQYL